MSESGLYVYAVVPTSSAGDGPANDAQAGDELPAGVLAADGLAADGLAADGLAADGLGTGINAVPLQLVEIAEGLAAVVHEHDAAPYDGADADVERWILEHGNVVERGWERAGTVLPMSFNVIVAAGEGATAEQRLAEWLGESAAALADRLNALANRVELRIEISLDAHAAAEDSEEIAGMREEMGQRPPGVKRLLQKRIDKMERDTAEKLADRLYPQYRRRLAGLSEELTESSRTRPPPGFVSVLAIAVLVHRDDVEKTGLELTSIQEEQPAAQIRFLGPWPPYSFADVPELATR